MVPEIWSVAGRIFCHFGLFFALLPPKNLKSQNFEKMKKTPRDIIILHECTKHQDHMLYCSWYMVHDGCNCYFSFWTFFCIFTTITAPKIKISKKWKKVLEMSWFYTSVPKIVIIWYVVSEIWCMTNVIVIFHFELFFALLLAWKMKISKKKKKKNPCWYHHFTQVYQKLGSYAILFLRYGMWLM